MSAEAAPGNLLIIDETGHHASMLGLMLEDRGYTVVSSPDLDDCLTRKLFRGVEAVLYHLPKESRGMAVLGDLLAQVKPVPVLVLGICKLEEAFAAIHAGAADIHPEKINPTHLIKRLETVLRERREQGGEGAEAKGGGAISAAPGGSPPAVGGREGLSFFARLDLGLETRPAETKSGGAGLAAGGKGRGAGRGSSPGWAETPRLARRPTEGELPFVGESEAFLKLANGLERAGQFRKSLLVSGPPGSEFRPALRWMLQKAGISRATSTILQAGALREDSWDFLFSDLVREAQGMWTVVLYHVDQLSLEAQEGLLDVLMRRGRFQNTAVQPRFVLVTQRDLNVGLEEGWVAETFYMAACLQEIRIPPLEERKADLAAISTGLAEALAVVPENFRDRLLSGPLNALLAGQAWPGNYWQLRETWRLLVAGQPELPLSPGELEKALAGAAQRVAGGGLLEV